jgi:hypothetical protein
VERRRVEKKGEGRRRKEWRREYGERIPVHFL